MHAATERIIKPMKKEVCERNEKINNIFIKFKSRIMCEFPVHDVTVYMFSKSESNGSLIIGEKIEVMVLERYISYSNTVVLCSPIGIQEADKKYKSRLITQIKIKDELYLLVISSYQMEAFKGVTKNIINDILKVRRDGEAIV